MPAEPLLLALDTTGESYALALGRGSKLLAEASGGSPRQHLVQLFPTLDLLVRQSGLSLSDCQGVAVTAGPGSFTGVRTGLLVARTLAQYLQVPVVPLDTLEVLAANVGEGGRVVAALDARKGEVVSALFHVKQGWPTPLEAHRLLAPDPWVASIPPESLVVGSACLSYRELLSGRNDLHLLPPESWKPRASTMLRLAYRVLRQGHGRKWSQLRPEYVRPADVQVHRGSP